MSERVASLVGRPRVDAARWAELLREVGGGFGDVGLLAPLAIALITLNHLNATAVLAGAGLFYLATALVYRLPVPVQPLKAVSAIAIASRLGPPGIAAAGLEIGVIFTLLSLTGLADRLRSVFVAPVVRGIQLGIGLLLAKAAVDLIFRGHQLHLAPTQLDQMGLGPAVLIGFGVTLALFVFSLRSVPGASLLLLAGGLVLGVLVGIHATPSGGLGPQPLTLSLPTLATFLSAFWVLTVPQVGLSVGNSLMATNAAARTYFGDRGARVTPGRLGLSMGLANLVVAPFSGMPMCHGAGGLTAHYKMGARTGLGIAVYGGFLLTLGLVFGASAAGLLSLIPVAVLGGFLLYVGFEHAALVADLKTQPDFLVAGAVAAVSVGTGNISAGVVVGLLMYMLLRRFAPPAPTTQGAT
ncbi:MAG TPA: putative sulfate/molybdate transporter [Candidatus Dormibacteraeota bacterium]